MKLYTVRFELVLSLYLFLQQLSRVKSEEVLSSPEQCARTCKEGEPPKTCYYEFTVEYYSTMSRACNLCMQDSTCKVNADCQCIIADGYERSGIITVNRMYPGPAITVCLNDNVIIDVTNRLPGSSTSIHWHGVYQRNYPYADGVPYVTQCPIPDSSTFRYQWKAENSGTQFWHAHSGIQKSEGLLGPLIIREPKSTEFNSHLWDLDEIDKVIVLTDWFHSSSADHFPGNTIRNTRQSPDNLLVNGMGQWTDPITGEATNSTLATFTVKAGYRYRFRLINACALTCPVQLTIEGHNGLTIIESDGEPFQPFDVDSITTLSAERYDFILNANQTPGNYWIQVRGLGACGTRKLQQFAVLHYDSAPAAPKRSTLSYNPGLETGLILNPLNVHCHKTALEKNMTCIFNQKGAVRVDSRIFKSKPEIKLYMPFGFYDHPPEAIFKSGTYRKYHVGVGSDQSIALLGYISNVSPSSPMLSQRADIPDSKVCSADDYASKCKGVFPCECVHIQKIPLNSVVELILVDEAQIPGLSHPFHLHGQPFYMIGEGDSTSHGIKHMNMSVVQDLDLKGNLNRHPSFTVDSLEDLEMVPAKDTIAVPNNGYTIIRFFADNPGYWLFHCHFEFHLIMGMSMVFAVGEPTDISPVPEGFPKCGQYTPPSIFNN